MSEVVLFFPRYESSDIGLLPMSILSVAASLVRNGYDVKIIDQRFERNWQEAVTKIIKNNPVAFGVSALTGKQILYGLEVSEFVKKHSNIPVVWGGVHPSLLSKQTLQNQYIDFVVIGEGEETFIELINALKRKTSIDFIKGIGYKKNNEIIINQQRDFINLNEIFDVPYDLVNIENYVAKKSFASGKYARDIALYTSRGCPHRCGFCYNKEFNKGKWRGKSAESVFREIKYFIDKYDINSLNIEDDEFFVDLKRAREICNLIAENNLNVEIFTTCRVNYVANNMDNEYLKLLHQAGFRTLAFGVESGSEKILNLIHKDITIAQIFETINRLKVAGINSKYYFMAGFPTETIEDLYKTTDLIYKMKKLDPNIRIPAWRIFTPYPGTDLYNLAIKEGWQPPQTLEEWANYDFNTVRMPWIDRKKKKIIMNVAFLINYIFIEKTSGSGFFFRLAKIFGKLVKWRWEKHYFSFVPERWIINFILKIKKA